MKTNNKSNLNYLLVFFFPPIFFYIGYYSKILFRWNVDIYFTHSLLIFFSIIFFYIIDKVFKKFKFNKYLRLISLSLLSSFFLGATISIIQNDIITTRWLELGYFSINDAVDYLNQSIQYLFENEVYSKKGRVVFPIMYAGFLGELKLNMQAIQLILSVLLAFITFSSAILIYKYYGYFYSLIFTGLSVDYLIEHIGGVCTEIIGFILGATGFIFFLKLKLSKKKDIKFFYLFLFFILFGYLIRPSLPLVLPALLAWGFF